MAVELGLDSTEVALGKGPDPRLDLAVQGLPRCSRRSRADSIFRVCSRRTIFSSWRRALRESFSAAASIWPWTRDCAASIASSERFVSASTLSLTASSRASRLAWSSPPSWRSNMVSRRSMASGAWPPFVVALTGGMLLHRTVSTSAEPVGPVG